MKKKIKFTVAVLLCIILAITLSYSKEHVSDFHKIEKIDSIPNFFKTQGFYFSGQLNEATFRSVKKDSVKLVINLRSEEENNKNKEEHFDEEKLVTKLGMKYISIPMSGIDSYNPETLDKVAKAINSQKGKILIHCAACGRVTYIWMAYLIKYCNYTVDEAVAVGKQMRFSFVLENLLDKEISMTLKR